MAKQRQTLTLPFKHSLHRLLGMRNQLLQTFNHELPHQLLMKMEISSLDYESQRVARLFWPRILMYDGFIACAQRGRSEYQVRPSKGFCSKYRHRSEARNLLTVFRYARGKQPGYQKETEIFPIKESPSCINASWTAGRHFRRKDAQH